MNLYETQMLEDLFLTLVPLDASNAAIWNGYYRGHYVPPYLSTRSADELEEKAERERRADQQQDSATVKMASGIKAGIAGFRSWQPDRDQDQYVAVASSTRLDPMGQDLEMLFDQIEMTMGVYASHREPFTSHMGIARTLNSLKEGKPHHRNLSSCMHAFSAKCMLLAHQHGPVPKTHMVNSPTEVMLHLLLKGLTEKGLELSVTADSRSKRPTVEDMASLKTMAEQAMGNGKFPDEVTLFKLNTYLLWQNGGPRDPFPGTVFGVYQGLLNRIISVRLSALEALVEFPHPITTRAM